MRSEHEPGEVGDGTENLEAEPELLADDDEGGWAEIDWVAFAFKASAVVVFGATLITSFDLSLNQGAEWQTVMRLAILPFVGGALLLAAAEFIERIGD